MNKSDSCGNCKWWMETGNKKGMCNLISHIVQMIPEDSVCNYYQPLTPKDNE